MNRVKFQDKKFIHRNLHSYKLTAKNQMVVYHVHKLKLGEKISIFILAKQLKHATQFHDKCSHQTGTR